MANFLNPKGEKTKAFGDLKELEKTRMEIFFLSVVRFYQNTY